MLGRFWVVTGIPYVTTVFVPCRDNVATEVSLSRPRRSRQEVGVVTELGSKRFRVTKETCSVATTYFMSRQRVA